MRTKSNAQSPTDNPEGPWVLFLPSPIPKVGQIRAHGRLSLNSSLLLERELHIGLLAESDPKRLRKNRWWWGRGSQHGGSWSVSGRLPGSCRAAWLPTLPDLSNLQDCKCGRVTHISWPRFCNQEYLFTWPIKGSENDIHPHTVVGVCLSPSPKVSAFWIRSRCLRPHLLPDPWDSVPPPLGKCEFSSDRKPWVVNCEIAP